MRLVIADTGPINYLILIGHIELLQALFDKVILPSTVHRELASLKAPPSSNIGLPIARRGSMYTMSPSTNPTTLR